MEETILGCYFRNSLSLGFFSLFTLPAPTNNCQGWVPLNPGYRLDCQKSCSTLIKVIKLFLFSNCTIPSSFVIRINVVC